MDKKTHLTQYDRGIIRQICGRIHVGTSDLDVIREIMRAIQGKHKRFQELTTRAFRRAFYAYAIECHRANQECYHKIMTGRI
jgi:hypothetical protein